MMCRPRGAAAFFATLVAACSGDRVPVRVSLLVSADQLAAFATVKSLRLTISGEGVSPRSVTFDAAERLSSALVEPLALRFDLAIYGLGAQGEELFRGARRNVVPPAAIELPVRQPNAFANALSPMRAARLHATATPLSDGRVLIAGGRTPAGEALATAEIFDPDTATFLETGAMKHAREHHGAARLSDGRVLVAGGETRAGFVLAMEIYNPSAGTFTEAGQLTTERAEVTVTPYTQGTTEKVLLAGGRGPSGAVASCDIYVPSLGSTAPPRNLVERRAGHAAVHIGDAILIAGGSSTAVRAEIFRTSDEGFSLTTGAMAAARPTAVALRTDAGRILVAGTTETVEEYVSASGMFRSVATLERAGAAAIAPLPSDRALIVSGASEPQRDAFIVGGAAPGETLGIARTRPALAPIADGSVLVVGGSGESTAEIFVPAAP